MKQSFKPLFILVFLGLLFSCRRIDLPEKPKDDLPNDLILEWNMIALEAAGGITYEHGLLASRVYAMMHIAIADALFSIKPLYETYAFKQRRSGNYFAAVVSAAYTVLAHEFPENKPMLDMKYEEYLSAIFNSQSKEEGIATGKAAAEAIIKLRMNDNAFENPVVFIDVSTVPGVYNVVPPFNFVFAPHWKTMIPFSMETYDQFRSAPPPALTSTRYTESFIEVRAVGELNSNVRTADESAYAKFWYELSEKGWNRIARVVAEQENTGLFATARLFALLNMALADAYTAGWDTKYLYNFWRPYTAIRAARNDGNNQTVPDLDWLPAEPTPPVPDYPSTHSALGNAAATVLSHVFSPLTTFTFSSSTGVPPTSTRTFTSFKQAADENADSRVKAGIHFRFATEEGQKQGDMVGEWTVNNYYLPLHKH